jgi:XRE family transcriptional regulator, regulator of sulfur utilization
MKAPTATLEELEVHITRLNAGQSSHPPHHHPNEELILLDQGIVETLSNGKWVRLEPGSVILNASESWHSLRSVGPGTAQYFVVNWRTPATDEIAARNPPDSAAAPH